jgi:DNA-binding transcriptional ArsR family regulator
MVRRSEQAKTRQQRAARELVDALDSGLFRALAEPVRVEILKLLLLSGASDINTIARRFPQDRSVLSRHLQTLLDANLVCCTKDGRRRIYSLSPRALIERLEQLVADARRLVSICCPGELS